MAKIYIVLKQGEQTEKFTGKDGKQHDKLWTIERKLSGNMQLCGATINGEARYIDFTLPTEVKKLPKGAKPVSDDVAERLWTTHTWHFGE